MNNFGVIELAGAKRTSAPGWAYVPDVRPNAAASAPKGKRARNAPPGLSSGDLSARQEAKVRKEVEALDRDWARDPSIPLPVKAGRAQVKHTPNVRKILQSQKTFSNHLDDFIAAQNAAETNQVASTARQPASSTLGRRVSTQGRGARAATEDVTMTDADAPSVLPPTSKPAPEAHPGDNDPLLVSRVPDIPTDEELQRLLAHPPLSYLEARGKPESKYPARVFCEVCGYWGRTRCTRCGTRVCALACMETHKEECVTRYGY